MLSNCGSTLNLVQGWLSRCLRSGLSPRPAQTAPVQPALYEPYAGLCRSDAGDLSTVRREGSHLAVHRLGKPGQPLRAISFEVFPQSDSVFYNKLWDTEVSFGRSTDGAGVKIIVAVPNGSIEATRIPDQVPPTPDPIQVDPRIYDGFAGQYRHTLLFGLLRVGPTLSVRREDDELGGHLMGYLQLKYLQALAPGTDLSTLGGMNVGGVEFVPETETTYRPANLADGLQLTFHRNREGTTTGLTASVRGTTFTAARISSKPADWK